MNYEYYNQFYLSNELVQYINSIISTNENVNYICKLLNFNIPEHREKIFSRKGISTNGEYGEYYERIVQEEEYCFFVIMKNDFFQRLSNTVFRSIDELKLALNVMSEFNSEYDGIFEANTLVKRFPYLQVFFDSLDKWRAKTNKVTLDDDILEKEYQKTIGIKG